MPHQIASEIFIFHPSLYSEACQAAGSDARLEAALPDPWVRSKSVTGRSEQNILNAIPHGSISCGVENSVATNLPTALTTSDAHSYIHRKTTMLREGVHDFPVHRNPSRVDSKDGDHFLQAGPSGPA